MTLNNVINRLKAICLAHKQIRSFYRGFPQDALTDQTRKFPAVFVEDNGGKISISGGATELNYRISFWDLVNVSEDTKKNEQDIDSDMLSIAMDVVAQINAQQWDDWAVSAENSVQVVYSEENGDMYGGVTVDIAIRIMFKQNICAVPSDLFFTPGVSGSEAAEIGDKLVYDLKYTADGTEGSSLTIDELKGKKILFITRESGPIYKVSNNPDIAEYTWDGNVIGLGKATNANERYLILYRNY